MAEFHTGPGLTPSEINENWDYLLNLMGTHEKSLREGVVANFPSRCDSSDDYDRRFGYRG
jgi:hypothetical protein